MIKVGENCYGSRGEGRDQAERNYNEKLPGIGKMELDLQEQKEVSS